MILTFFLDWKVSDASLLGRHRCLIGRVKAWTWWLKLVKILFGFGADGLVESKGNLSSLCKEGGTVSLSDMRKKVKNGWLQKLNVIARIADRHEDSVSLKAGIKGRVGTRSVHVHSHKKKTKELSSLYATQEFPAHNGLIKTIKFSHDGRYLASAGEDSIVRIWGECFVVPATGTTSTLKRHITNCNEKKKADRKQQLLKFQQVSDEDQGSSSSFHVLTNGKYDPRITRDTVQAMICGGDWIRKLHGGKKKNKKRNRKRYFSSMSWIYETQI